jgi:hypothetical protein
MKHRKPTPKRPISDRGTIVEGAASAVGKFLADPFVRGCALSEFVSDREYAELFLKGISQGFLSVPDWQRLLGGAQVELVSPSEPYHLKGELIQYYRSVLGHLLTDESPERTNRINDAYLRLESKLSGRVASVPAIYSRPIDRSPAALRSRPIALQNSELTISHKVIAVDTEASLDYAFALVLSKFLKDLHQCQLASCGKFFLVNDEQGRYKQREYCTPEHREESLNRRGSQRVQASRAKMSAEEWRALKECDPQMTPQKWNAIKLSHSRLTASKWIAQQNKSSEPK